MKDEVAKLKRELILKEKELLEIKNSTCWKITKPIRSILNFLKRLFFLVRKSFFLIKEEGFIFFIKKLFFFLRNMFSIKLYNPVYLFFKSKKIIKKSQDKLEKFLEGKEIVMFAPWVVLGGADKLIIEYLRALKNNLEACLITTVKSGDRVNWTNTQTFDLNSGIKGWSYLTNDSQETVLFNVIMNSNIKIIHIVNSETAIRMVIKFADRFKEKRIKVVSSLFALGYDRNVKNFSGYPIMYPEIMSKSDLVLSDNNYWFNIFKDIIGVDFKYKKIHSPVKDHNISKLKFSHNKKILWASRICDTKFIDILFKICEKKEEIDFIVYGNKGEDEYANYFFEKILNLKNVEYRGHFDDFTQVDYSEFDLFLYTSYIDGLPNIILEIASVGLPIISSKICGIPEVLGDSKLLVNNIENVNEYLDKIDLFYNNSIKFFMEAVKIMDEVKIKHSKNIFSKEYLDSIDYLLKS